MASRIVDQLVDRYEGIPRDGVRSGRRSIPRRALSLTIAHSPAADSDGDGIPDKMDKCPDKKEDGQAPNPKDGCPKT
jgi:hypothetical protein